MTIKSSAWLSVVTVVATACATIPTGPSVMVLPGTAKSFEQFQGDDAICRQWSAQQTGTTTRKATTQSTASGAAIGTAVGAAAGAALGAAAGNPAVGAAAGAGGGLLAGTAIGAGNAPAAGSSVQRRYDVAYMQCMYAKGHQIPVARSSQPAYTAAPPPAGHAAQTPPGVPPPPAGAPPAAPPASSAPPAPPECAARRRAERAVALAAPGSAAHGVRVDLRIDVMRQTPTLRIGVVGSRFAAHLHRLAYRRVHGIDVRLVGVASPSPERREAFARESGATPYATIGAMLPHVDVVDVCSPPATHEPVALEAIDAGKHVIVEKPFTGAFGPSGGSFAGNRAAKDALLKEALASADRIVQAARRRGVVLAYAENWIYAPAVQKEREIIEKTDAQILWMLGGESHSGSHSPVYGIWRHAGGGSLVGKGCHPLSACLYLKHVEGRARGGRPIRPATVSCRVHEITRLPGFRDRGFLRTDYEDIEDYSQLHVTFEEGTVADVYATELVLGGVHNWLEVFANNHRTTCRLNPVNLLDTYNPDAAQFRDVYVVEKIGTKEGWSHPAADEEWQQGFYAEVQDFVECCVSGGRPQSGPLVAHDTIATLYAGYVSAERSGHEVRVPVAPLGDLD